MINLCFNLVIFLHFKVESCGIHAKKFKFKCPCEWGVSNSLENTLEYNQACFIDGIFKKEQTFTCYHSQPYLLVEKEFNSESVDNSNIFVINISLAIIILILVLLSILLILINMYY